MGEIVCIMAMMMAVVIRPVRAICFIVGWCQFATNLFSSFVKSDINTAISLRYSDKSSQSVSQSHRHAGLLLLLRCLTDV